MLSTQDEVQGSNLNSEEFQGKTVTEKQLKATTKAHSNGSGNVSYPNCRCGMGQAQQAVLNSATGLSFQQILPLSN
jgi:hypothetical protein